MRRLLASCAALLLLACARPVAAQVYGQFGGAVPVAVDHRQFGFYGEFSDHQSDLLGQLRLSFYPNLDFGFQGGLSHLDAGGRTQTVVHLGADVKTLVARRTDTFPVDVSVGGTIGVGSADQFNLLSMGPLAVASRTATMRSGLELVPYGGAALLYTRSDFGHGTTTDVSMQLRVGLEVRPNPDVRLLVELQEPVSDPIDQNPKLVLGANFPF